MNRHTLLMLPLLLGGCALGPGQPFAVLEPTFTAGLQVPEGRDAGEGWQRLDTSYQVKFTVLELTLAPLQLQESAASGPLTFDPADPPPGYTICHNGHCDREDGALVSYEEVQAELNAGAGGARTLVSLPLGTVDALAGATVVQPCEPSCDLPFTSLTAVRAPVLRVRMSGLLRDAAVPARIAETAWTLEADLAQRPVTLSGELELEASNTQPLYAQLETRLLLSGRLWDGVEVASLDAPGGTIDLAAAPNAEGLHTLLENLTATSLHTEVTRR